MWSRAGDKRRLVEGLFEMGLEVWLATWTGLESPRVAQVDEGVPEAFCEDAGPFPRSTAELTVGGATGAFLAVAKSESGSSSDESESNISSNGLTRAGGWVFAGTVIATALSWFRGGLSDRNMSSGGELKRGEALRLVRPGAVRVRAVRVLAGRRRLGRGVRAASCSGLDRQLMGTGSGGATMAEIVAAIALAPISSSESVTTITSGQRLVLVTGTVDSSG